VDPQGRAVWLSADVELAEETDQPMAVFVSAFASSAVYWDGKLIGTNGRPAATRELERPGLRDAAFLIGPAKPGVHKLVLQMSSHHGSLRLRSSVMRVRVAPYETPLQLVLRDYLPALITAGGLLIAGMVFGFACWFRPLRESGKYLVGAAFFATAQLIAETSRAFIPHIYPTHILRLCFILFFAAGFGFMLLNYLLRRFEVRTRGPVLLVHVVVTAAIIAAVSSFDQKTGLVLSSALIIGILLTFIAAKRSAPGALPILLTLAAGLALPLMNVSRFLDRDVYLWVMGLFVVLFADGARQLKRGSLAATQAPARCAASRLAVIVSSAFIGNSGTYL
jgi:hypothetical protein